MTGLWRRRLRRILLVFVALLVLLIIFAPSLAGTDAVRGLVSAQIASAIGREVRLGSLSAGWTSGVALSDLSIPNDDPGFAGPALLEVSSVRVEDSLVSLIFGGPSRIVVEGLTLRVEEQAGGRTNIDDIIKRLTAPPRGVPAEAPERKPPGPIAVELADCTVELRLLPYQPPEKPLDPFKEDPVVRAADEGAIVVGVTGLNLSLDADAQGLRMSFDGGLRLGDSGGELDGAIAIAGEDVSGRINAKGVDVSILSRILPVELRGITDLAVEGSLAEGAKLQLRVNDFHVSGEDIPTTNEKWIALRAAIQREGEDRFRIDTLKLESATGELGLEGSGLVPPAPGAKFEFSGFMPGRLLPEPGDGVASFSISGVGRENGADVTGSFDLDILFDAEDLRQLGRAHADFDFDLGYTPERLEIRRCTAKAERFEFDLAGSTSLTSPPVYDLTGKVEVGLDLVHHFLLGFVEGFDNTDVTGTLRIQEFTVRHDAGGNLTVKADGSVEDLVAEGIFDNTVRIDHSRLHLDAALEENGDLLRITAGQLDDLRASGMVAGLTKEKLTKADGTVKGTLRLVPVVAVVAGLPDLIGLGGLLEVDLTAATDEHGVHVRGTANVTDFQLDAAGVEANADRIGVSGSFSPGTPGEMEIRADVTVDGLTAVNGGEEIALDRTELAIDAALEEGGSALRINSGRMNDLHVEGRILGLDEDRPRHVEGTIKGSVKLTPGMAHFAGLTEIRRLGGTVAVDLTAETEAGTMRLHGTTDLRDILIEGAAGTTEIDALALSGEVRDAAGTITATVKATGKALTAEVELDAKNATFDISTPAVEDLLALAPMIALPAGLDLAGPLTANGTAARSGGSWTIDAELRSPDMTARYDGRGLAGDAIRLTCKATQVPGGWRVTVPEAVLPERDVVLKLPTATVHDNGRITGKIALEGDLGKLSALVPDLKKSALAGRMDLDCAFVLADDLVVDGRLTIDDLAATINERRLDPQRLDLRFLGGTAPGGFSIENAKLTLGTTVFDIAARIDADGVRISGGGHGLVEEWTRYLPDFSGKGKFDLSDLSVTLPKKGIVEVSGRFTAAELNVAGARTRKPNLDVTIRAEHRDERLHLRKAKLVFKTELAEYDNLSVRNLVIREDGTLENDGYHFDSEVEADRMRVGEAEWEGLDVHATGLLDSLLEERAKAQFSGDVAFSRWLLGPVVCEEGHGEFDAEDGILRIRDFIVNAEKGRAKLNARLTPEGGKLRWEARVSADDIELREELGDPLSFILPILRIGSRKHNHGLTGKLSIDDLQLSGSDVTAEALETSLRGRGRIRLEDIEARGSILLPLLGLRLDKILLDKGYKFSDLTVIFNVADGVVTPNPLKLKGRPFGIEIKGHANLNGTIDFLVAPDLLPIPFRVKGPIEKPRVTPAPFALLNPFK